MATADNAEQTLKARPRLHNMSLWAQRVGLYGKLAIALCVITLLAGILTYAVWTESSPIGPRPKEILILIIVDLILLLSVAALIARHLVRLWVQRRAGSAGSRLHARFVGLFSVVAVTPAIITAVFSAGFFYLGIQEWFSDRVRTAVMESLAVSEAYILEHRQAIRADVLAMANDVNRQIAPLLSSRLRFQNFLQTQIVLRNLSEATVFTSSGRVLGRTSLSLFGAFATVPTSAMDKAVDGEVVIFSDALDDQVKALVQLETLPDAYLYVGRFIDPTVQGHVERTRDAVSEYQELEGQRSSIQITSALIFIVVAMMLLLGAIWVGLIFATRLVRPITDLVTAAERVRQGDFSARVAEGEIDDEISTLSRAFNRMTQQLAGQRGELVEANRQLDNRRRFTEAVLSGVSAGVIGIDLDGTITLPNRSAAAMLGADVSSLIGQTLAETVPEMADLLQKAKLRRNRTAEDQITLVRNGRARTLLVRIGAEFGRAEQSGFVVTFDDITDLVRAQRTAAWADVARRIAHEIKNPLTPIQLSAERLRRRYMPDAEKERAVFQKCTDTIVRQVNDIGQMVDEFSAFARMPAPRPVPTDLVELARQCVFTEELSHPAIAYELDAPDHPVTVAVDPRQLTQVYTNLLKNAAEAIEEQSKPPGDDGSETEVQHRIAIEIAEKEGIAEICIRDSGPGLPLADRHHLTEPYVTRRAKGTGLGLAIVKKILDDHGALLHLENTPSGGAAIRIELPQPAQAEDKVLPIEEVAVDHGQPKKDSTNGANNGA